MTNATHSIYFQIIDEVFGSVQSANMVTLKAAVKKRGIRWSTKKMADCLDWCCDQSGLRKVTVEEKTCWTTNV
jgi:hypothetical protein